MERSSEPGPGLRKKRFGRIWLRAFNGAVLALIPGGLLGAGLGWTFARIVVGNDGRGVTPEEFAMYGAYYGTFAGLLGGVCIGATIVIRNNRKGFIAGTAIGVLIGLGYDFLVRRFLFPYFDLRVYLSLWASGLIGGLVLAGLMRWIRGRWSWWSRWDE